MKFKRTKRRIKREALHGPEVDVLVTGDGSHDLSCGHTVDILPDEQPGIKRRRCYKCLPIIQRIRYWMRNRQHWSIDAIVMVSFFATMTVAITVIGLVAIMGR